VKILIMRLNGAVKKSEITTLRKCLKFNFITLSKTFFLMPKLQAGKETVKFLAIFGHPLWSAPGRAERRRRFVRKFDKSMASSGSQQFVVKE
jgi:hypothetical protein